MQGRRTAWRLVMRWQQTALIRRRETGLLKWVVLAWRLWRNITTPASDSPLSTDRSGNDPGFVSDSGCDGDDSAAEA